MAPAEMDGDNYGYAPMKATPNENENEKMCREMRANIFRMSGSKKTVERREIELCLCTKHLWR